MHFQSEQLPLLGPIVAFPYGIKRLEIQKGFFPPSLFIAVNQQIIRKVIFYRIFNKVLLIKYFSSSPTNFVETIFCLNILSYKLRGWNSPDRDKFYFFTMVVC